MNLNDIYTELIMEHNSNKENKRSVKEGIIRVVVMTLR